MVTLQAYEDLRLWIMAHFDKLRDAQLKNAVSLIPLSIWADNWTIKTLIDSCTVMQEEKFPEWYLTHIHYSKYDSQL